MQHIHLLSRVGTGSSWKQISVNVVLGDLSSCRVNLLNRHGLLQMLRFCVDWRGLRSILTRARSGLSSCIIEALLLFLR